VPRICIVAPQLPIFGGSSESAHHSDALAQLFAGQPEHCVTLVLTAALPQQGLAACLQHYNSLNVQLVPLSQCPLPEYSRPGMLLQHVCSQALADYAAAHSFDCIFFPDVLAMGYVAIQTKRAGLALHSCRLVVMCSEPTPQAQDLNAAVPANPLQDLKDSHMRRYCAQHADVLVSPTQQVFSGLQGSGWRLTARRLVHSYLLPKSAQRDSDSRPTVQGDAEESWLALGTTDAAQVSLSQAESPGSQPHTPQAALGDDSPAPPCWPPITVCIPHYNAGAYFTECLSSLAETQYPNFTVIAVDDGSTEAASRAQFDAMQRHYSPRGWQFYTQHNGGPGLARNAAAQRAGDGLLVFFDADDVADMDLLHAYARAMQTSAADCLTCYHLAFDAASGPGGKRQVLRGYVPLGACWQAGIGANVFGGANFCIKRSVYWQLGGYTDRAHGCEDWEFLARLVLQGYDLQVVPKNLFYYRQWEQSLSRRVQPHGSYLRAISPYTVARPETVGRLIEECYVPLHNSHQMLLEQNSRLQQSLADQRHSAVQAAVQAKAQLHRVQQAYLQLQRAHRAPPKGPAAPQPKRPPVPPDSSSELV
jgi:alpha-1,6-rhamnosyltransferase